MRWMPVLALWLFEVYNADDKITHLWRDLDLLEAYRALDSVSTGKIPSLFCDTTVLCSLITTTLEISH